MNTYAFCKYCNCNENGVLILQCESCGELVCEVCARFRQWYPLDKVRMTDGWGVCPECSEDTDVKYFFVLGKIK